MTVRVFLVDDHPMFLMGVRVTLQEADDVEVVGEASSGPEAVEALRKTGPPVDVVLMDLQVPGGSGAETIRSIVSGPAAEGRRPRVLVVAMSEDDETVVAALRAGAHGYTVKWAPRRELLRAVYTVADGGAVFSPSVAARLGSYFTAVHALPSRLAFPQLTGRELQVLDLLARGYTNRRIARELVLAEKTIRNHVSHVFMKLQVSDRAAAAIRARNAGLGT